VPTVFSALPAVTARTRINRETGKFNLRAHTLSISKVSGLSVPVPSAAEQEQVVDAIVQPLSEIGRLSDEIELAIARSNALRQSILRRAFSGQLVPQDPNDEPASVLLEHIRAECKANSNAPKKTTKRTKGEAA
jgi:type I restriction enzyme S subunit